MTASTASIGALWVYSSQSPLKKAVGLGHFFYSEFALPLPFNFFPKMLKLNFVSRRQPVPKDQFEGETVKITIYIVRALYM